MLMTNGQLREILKNPLFVFGAIIVFIAILVSLAGSSIRPDSSPYANDQHLEISALKPFSKVTFLKLKKDIPYDNGRAFSSHFIGSRNKFDLIPIDTIYIANGEILYRKIGNEIKSLKLNESFNDSQSIEGLTIQKTFVLGTDRYGRDLLSRLMSGTYISLSVGIISVLISLILGITLGLIAGYYRGWIDRIIVWFINVVWSIPTLLLVIAITLVLGKGFWQIFIAVGLTMWVEVARIVRGQVMSIREKEYVEAGVVLGFSDFRIIFRHILPNVLSPVIVISAANFATAILLEAGLSFLGIGAPPPHATWGKMISEHKAYLITGDAHLAIIPGIAIMLMVLSFTFIGNALRDVLDERRLERA